MDKAEELLRKLQRLDEIPQKGWEVRGKPNRTQTLTINGESLVRRWYKRCEQYKINLINQFKSEVCEKQRYICQTEYDKDSVQDKNNKWYVSCEGILNSPEPE